MIDDSCAILFIHIGPALPPWLGGALRQARIFNTAPIYLVAESRALEAAKLPSELDVIAVHLETLPVSEKHKSFRRISPMDTSFADGFWTFTTERFFVVESAMRQLNLRNVLHLENDVLLYCDLTRLAPTLAGLYSGVASTFINDVLCVPGLVYFPDVGAAARLTRALIGALEAAIRAAPTLEQRQRINDMVLLGMLRAEGAYLIDHLPIVPPDYPAPLRSDLGHVPDEPSRYSANFGALNFIFDGAALGQYLGGVDPRNARPPSNGFVNPSTVFDPRLLKPHMTADSEGRKFPVVETTSGIIRIANLHMHSKDLRPFLSM